VNAKMDVGSLSAMRIMATSADWGSARFPAADFGLSAGACSETRTTLQVPGTARDR